MARYVDMDACPCTTCENVMNCPMFDGCKKYDKWAKGIDVAPVVHGHWIPLMLDDPVFEGVNVENIKSLNGKMNRCSVCGADIITNGIDDTGKGIVATVTNQYCRWCGAKMDGKEGEQE